MFRIVDNGRSNNFPKGSFSQGHKVTVIIGGKTATCVASVVATTLLL